MYFDRCMGSLCRKSSFTDDDTDDRNTATSYPALLGNTEHHELIYENINKQPRGPKDCEEMINNTIMRQRAMSSFMFVCSCVIFMEKEK